jgi:hypothetical protein
MIRDRKDDIHNSTTKPSYLWIIDGAGVFFQCIILLCIIHVSNRLCLRMH